MSLTLPDFDLSDEQRDFRDMLRRFFEEHAPMTRVREVMESEGGCAPELWAQAGGELGLAGLAIPEACGGQGFGLPELAIALEEAGRALAPIPLLASAGLAARAVLAVAGEEAGAEWLRGIAEGHAATLAWVEPAGAWGVAEVAAEFREVEGRFALDGEKSFVMAAGEAERFFVVAREAGSRGLAGLGLFAVEAGSEGLDVAALESLDPTRRLFRMGFRDVSARPVGNPGTAGSALERALEEAMALSCAETVGGMQKVLESAVDYAADRYQFGRPIGSFQAVKHKCADMLIDFEASRTAVRAALLAADGEDPERSTLASVAKAQAGPAFVRMATENLQIHGGVGYTWEYDAHLFFRRAKSSEILFGDVFLHREALAQSLVEAR